MTLTRLTNHVFQAFGQGLSRSEEPFRNGCRCGFNDKACLLFDLELLEASSGVFVAGTLALSTHTSNRLGGGP